MVSLNQNHSQFVPPTCYTSTSISSPFSMFSYFGVWVSCKRSPSNKNLTLFCESYTKIHKYSLSLAVGIHKFLELGCCLNFEEYFFTVLNQMKVYLAFDLEVEMLSSAISSCLCFNIFFLIHWDELSTKSIIDTQKLE